MAREKVEQITAWSFSRYKAYEACPFKAKLAFINKMKEPPNTAMDRGIRIHSLAEAFVNAKEGTPCPPELELFEEDFLEARKMHPVVECEWAFTNIWEPTSWFGKDAWCRVKTDLTYTSGNELIVVDHKTGKRNEDHKEQLSLYALAGFIINHDIDVVRGALWYLDQGAPIVDQVYTRNQMGELADAWEEKTRPMLNDTIFAPKPGNACRWCHWKKSNGGPCKF
jgi:CRISPR/Cas system-associated exonuclease Cas4 (RecB family)